jgi:hypothetical protein
MKCQTGNNESNPPEREFRAGVVIAAIWRTPANQAGTRYDQFKIRVQKRYKDDKDGGWKTTSFFQAHELPKLALVANKAFEYVTLRPKSAASSMDLGDDDARPAQ